MTWVATAGLGPGVLQMSSLNSSASEVESLNLA